MKLFDRIFGAGGELSDGVKADLYDNVETDIDYSPERAIRVGQDASEHVNFDYQGAVTLESGVLLDASSEEGLRSTFGDMLFGDDRNSRTTPKMIETGEGVTYEEIGAATIGAGLAAAKVDEVGHTPYTPAYGDLFATVVKGNWNLNPDIVSDFEEETGYYQEIVQKTAETVESQMLELRPENGIEEIDQQLETEKEDQLEKETE